MNSGYYVREVFNPKGEFIITKIHKEPNVFFLLSGSMSIMSEKGEEIIQAPHYGITLAGSKRVIYTHADCVFVTVHRSDAVDIESAEKQIIANSYDEIKEGIA